MFSKIRQIKLKKHEVISKAWFVGCFITGMSLVTFAASPTTVTNRPSTRAAREAKMISTIQKVTTTSSSTTLSSLPDARLRSSVCNRECKDVLSSPQQILWRDCIHVMNLLSKIEPHH